MIERQSGEKQAHRSHLRFGELAIVTVLDGEFEQVLRQILEYVIRGNARVQNRQVIVTDFVLK